MALSHLPPPAQLAVPAHSKPQPGLLYKLPLAAILQ